MRAILPLLLLAIAAVAPTASADASLSAVGPCDDPGAAAVVTCAAANGEDLACNAVVGADDCVRETYCALYWVSTEDCWWPNDDATLRTGVAFVGPCDHPGAVAVAECAAYNGEVLVCNAINGHDDCIRPQDAERLVCNLVFGTDHCLPVAIQPDAIGSLAAGGLAIGPCDDPGLVAVVECVQENGEILVCSAVFGDRTPCITRFCQQILDNCPLDPKGPGDDALAAASPPSVVRFYPCEGGPSLLGAIHCSTYFCAGVNRDAVCVNGLP